MNSFDELIEITSAKLLDLLLLYWSNFCLYIAFFVFLSTIALYIFPSFPNPDHDPDPNHDPDHDQVPDPDPDPDPAPAPDPGPAPHQARATAGGLRLASPLAEVDVAV